MLVVLDKYVAVMRLYTKTGAQTSLDKLIPHALDAFTADLIVQDLAITRPFAELAVKICYSNHQDIINLYKYHLLSITLDNLLVKTSTQTMESITFPIFAFGITINS